MVETEEEEIQRLVKEGIAKAEDEEEWEEKRRAALSAVSWGNTLITSLGASIALTLPMIIVFGLGINIAIISGIIIFIIFTFLFINTRNSIPKTLAEAKEKGYKSSLHR